MQRLQNEPQIVQILQSFVPLELQVNSADFQAFAQKYPPPGNGIPMMFAVSSSGEELDKISGAPQGAGLNAFLARALSRAAIPGQEPEEATVPQNPAGDPRSGPSEAQIKSQQRRLATLVRRAQNFVEKNEYAAAAAIVGPLLENTDSGTSEDLDQLAAALEQKAVLMLAVVDDRLQSGQLLLAAVALVETERVFGIMSGTQEKLAAARDAVAAATGGDAALRQAELVDVARAAEAERNVEEALRGYQSVIEKYPDTQVAEMSKVRISQLNAARQAAGGVDLEKAESMYNMAQAIAQREPEKARKYLEQVIQIAPPGSAVANRAQALLEQLN